MSDENPFSLVDLPFELIQLILNMCSLSDIKEFVKAFPELDTSVRSSPLWANKLCAVWPDLVELRRYDPDWGRVYKEMKRVHQFCRERIKKMSSKYYWAKVVLPKQDMKLFFDKCREYGGFGYIYVMSFLKCVCSTDTFYPDDTPVTDRVDMSQKYYASMIMDTLNQKKLKKLIPKVRKKNHVTTDVLLSLFNNWIEPLYGNPLKSIRKEILRLVQEVENALPFHHPLYGTNIAVRRSWTNRVLKQNRFHKKACEEIISLTHRVMVKEGLISSMAPDANTFLIKNGPINLRDNYLVFLVIFENVLRCCGVHCQMLNFASKYFFLWREDWTKENPVYFLDPFTGTLKMENVTVRSREPERNTDKIIVKSKMLFCLAVTFKNLRGVTKRHLKNALELIYKLHPTNAENILALNEIYIEQKRELINVDIIGTIPPPQGMFIEDHSRQDAYINRKRQKKLRSKPLMFTVGEICMHVRHRYYCVIRGWDHICTSGALRRNNLPFPRIRPEEKLPFYYVYASDFTKRYVAEANLVRLVAPPRLNSIEDVISVDFSHYNGYVYIPNKEKESEYPEDTEARHNYR